MLIVALVLAVIGLVALVSAVVTSNELIAWVCIVASVLGVVLLIVDALRDRSRGPAAATEGGESADPDALDSSAEETYTEDTYAEDYPDEAPVAWEAEGEPSELRPEGEPSELPAEGEPPKAADGEPTEVTDDDARRP